MSPQYHSASCRAMLLFMPLLLVTDVGLGGFGGRAVGTMGAKAECKYATAPVYILISGVSRSQHVTAVCWAELRLPLKMLRCRPKKGITMLLQALTHAFSIIQTGPMKQCPCPAVGGDEWVSEKSHSRKGSSINNPSFNCSRAAFWNNDARTE